MWLLILKSPLAWMGAALLAVSAYAAVQHTRLGWCQANFAQFRADVQSEAAKAQVRNAEVALQQEQAAMEALDDLQTRNDALRARYDRLRKSASPGSGPVPADPGTAPAAGSGLTRQPDPAPRCVPEGRVLAVLEAGDRELAKYRELWELAVRNAKAD